MIRGYSSRYYQIR